MTRKLPLLSVLVLCLPMYAVASEAAVAAKPQAMIVCDPNSTVQELLAAKEIRRYAYLRTGALLPVEQREALPEGIDAIVVANRDRAIVGTLASDADVKATMADLASQQYLLRTIPRQGQRVLLVVGGDSIGTLYGAYRLAEHLGVRFYLHGDVVPDQKIAWKLPELNDLGKPLFALRGVNPWGWHVFGIDSWSTDDYKAIFTQLAKMRMNFLGVHCYPEGKPAAEPTVWHGLTGDFDAQGRVKLSYVTRFYNTQLPGRPWTSFLPRKTGSYSFGGALLFDNDDWAPPALVGHCPRPQTPDACNEVFNRMEAQLHDAFTFARRLGVKTCLGTEAPLMIPKVVQERLKSQGKNPSDPAIVREVYEGTFRRIMASHPLDYYWIWTPESWTWQGNKPEQYKATVADIKLAIQAIKNVQAPFKLATAGWVLGPVNDRAAFNADLPKDVPVSAISRNVGHIPVDAAFGQITGREKWAIPWLESDEYNGLAAAELIIGRMRKDAADALSHGCTGLMGLHWRTDILAPNASALALAAWDQRGWNPNVAKPSGAKIFPVLVDNFYADWAVTSFGAQAGPAIGRIFTVMDGKVPISVARTCPSGKLTADLAVWKDVAKRYAFVDDLARLRSQVEGAGNLDRFDYWLNTFRYHRGLHQLRCALGQFNQAMQKCAAESDLVKRKALATEQALPAYKDMVRLMSETYGYLLATFNTNGGMAMVINMENHPDFWTAIVDQPRQRLAKTLDTPLPPDAQVSRDYQGPPRLIVPTIRGNFAPGEVLTLKVVVLAATPPSEAAVFWRELGNGTFQGVPLKHTNRGLYTASFPPGGARADIEYYVEATTSGKQVRFPATAPALNQTLVLLP